MIRLQISMNDFARDMPLLLFVVSIFLSIITWDPALMVLVILVLVNVLIVCFLKGWIKQDRPRDEAGQITSMCGSVCNQMGIGVSSAPSSSDRWGMPSSHTQVVFSFFAFAIFLIVWRILPNMPSNSFKHKAMIFFTIPVFVLSPCLVAYQRIHSRCHSLAQVVVGAILGIATALIAAWLTTRIAKGGSKTCGVI
jgi:membrane-associated phospholipid phosphatase